MLAFHLIVSQRHMVLLFLQSAVIELHHLEYLAMLGLEYVVTLE